MIQHSAPYLGPEEQEAAARVLSSGRLAQGPEVQAFERECAEFLGRSRAVAVSSGTNALALTLRALDVAPDDPIAIPSYACAALLQGAWLSGGRPILCDCLEDGNLDVNDLPPEAVAAVVVHSFGATAELPQAGMVVEDIAQSFGGNCGRSTIAAITSFYATKLMTTGEGGMVFTDDQGLAEFVRDRRDYDNRDTLELRFNFKMTEIQAAIGRVQLKRLPWFLERRAEIAAQYNEGLRHLPLQLPRTHDHVYFRYVIGTEKRDALEKWLNDNGVEAKRPVYRPLHRYHGIGTLPGAERAHDRFLSLPVFPALGCGELKEVVRLVDTFFSTYAG